MQLFNYPYIHLMHVLPYLLCRFSCKPEEEQKPRLAKKGIASREGCPPAAPKALVEPQDGSEKVYVNRLFTGLV